MVFTLAWAEAVPADTDAANQLGLYIRNMKRDVRERIDLEHYFPITDTANTGKHKAGSAKVYTNILATPPANDAAVPGSIWIPSDSLAVRVDNGTAWLLVGAGGDCVRAFHSVAQTIPTSVVTTFAFDSEQFDSNNLHNVSINNSRLVAASAGKYMFGCNIGIAAHSEAVSGYIEVLVNGSTFSGARHSFATTGAALWTETAIPYLLAAGDYITAVMQHTSFGAISITVAPYFWMYKVA